MNPPTVCVIGGGIGGASAALHLARSGIRVRLIEGADQLGGLVASFSVGGVPLERFYHHVFPQEAAIQELIGDLGLADRFSFLPSTVGVLTDGKLWPFTTPRDFLSFAPLSVADRARLGIGGLRMSRNQAWQSLDDIPAVQWLRRMTGDGATSRVWVPLLKSKFGTAWKTVPAAWMWGRFDQRRGARDRSGREHLGYLRGGFAQLFEALQKRLVEEGVEVQLGCRVTALAVDNGAVRRVVTDLGELESDAVLWTAGLSALSRLVPTEHADPRWTATGRLAVTSVIVELDRPVTDIYWTNICDDSVPYGAIVEHTNFVPLSDYGRHVVYLARYHTDGEAISQEDPQSVGEAWIADLLRRFPNITRSAILDWHVFRAPYAAPLVQLGHSRRIAPLASHIDGLYVATTAQIYPHDRGMNDGIVLARQAADLMLGRLETSGKSVAGSPLGRCPVCGSSNRRPRYRPSPSPTGAECGVRADGFRPATSQFGHAPGLVAGCSHCGHASVAMFPDAVDVSHAYEHAEDPATLSEQPGRLLTASRALQQIERYGASNGTSSGHKTILDVGCWTGEFLLAARQRGWRVRGIEPSKWAAGIAQEAGLDVTLGELRDAEIPANSVDVVVMTDVLEHLENPSAMLTSIRRLLTSSGLLYVTVPDAGSRLARTLGQHWWSVLPMHLHYFTRRSLSEILQLNGFDVLEIDTHAKAFAASYYAERLAGYSPLLARAVRRGLATARLGDRLIAPDFRDRMQVIARHRHGA